MKAAMTIAFAAALAAASARDFDPRAFGFTRPGEKRK